MAPNSFVLDVPPADVERRDTIDVYRPVDSDDSRRAAVVFVHGAPLPPNVPVGPRDWPVFVGYGSLAAAHGAVGVTFEYQLRTPAECTSAAGEIASAVAQARALPDVDPNRIAIWFFSGGGLLAADWLRDPPAWLRGIAFNYPVLEPLPDWGIDARFRPVDAVATSGRLPILLVRAGLERTEFASGVEKFVSAATAHRAHLDVVDVVDGHHGFDAMATSDAARQAVTTAMNWVVAKLD